MTDSGDRGSRDRGAPRPGGPRRTPRVDGSGFPPRSTGRGSPRRGGGDKRRGGGDERRGGRDERRGGRDEWRGASRDRDGAGLRSGERGRGGPRGRAPLGSRGGRPEERGVFHRDRPPRVREPEIPEDIDGRELDRAVWTELRTLSKDNAEGVARHLVAVSRFLVEEDLDRALAHAQTAARRAGRVAAVREALGIVHHRRGEWAKALAEYRTARRLSGSDHVLPQMADCERGLGRPERAIALAAAPEAAQLSRQDRVELAIVVSGARRDLGQVDAAVLVLRDLAQSTRPQQPGAARLYYAYADSLLAAGDQAAAREWFSRAVDADRDLETDAADRLAELDGIVLVDLEDELAGDRAPDGEPAEGEDDLPRDDEEHGGGGGQGVRGEPDQEQGDRGEG